MHKNNFDFLRLIFAILVIVTHSYVLSGSGKADWLSDITQGQINFSSLGVKGFFIISGYLIFQSALRSHSWGDFMIRRLLRIYPALIVVLILTVLLGAMVSDFNATQYFASHSTWLYVPVNLGMFFPQPDQLPGVFIANHYKNSVNGSLWTIPYEFLFYILFSFLLFIQRFPRFIKATVFIALLLIWIWIWRHEDTPARYIINNSIELHMLAHFGLCFLGGACLYIISIAQSRYKAYILFSALALIVFFIAIKQFYFTQFILLPVSIICIGTYTTRGISLISSRMGDFSYGIYIYGFLVQQTLMHYFNLYAFRLMVLSVAITFILGAASWHFIEKRALALKRYFP
ncbi:MAG: acyltransferase [Taibaiella sp.]|nr:acyltransferase [Taibaiella sp.]